jgi:hypothetical protein
LVAFSSLNPVAITKEPQPLLQLGGLFETQKVEIKKMFKTFDRQESWKDRTAK